jgi:hypothetical protein
VKASAVLEHPRFLENCAGKRDMTCIIGAYFCDSWEFPTLLIKIPSTYWSFIRESMLAAMERRMLWRVLGSSVQRILATGLSSKKNKLVVKVSSHSSFMLTLESFVGVDCMH